MHFTFKGVKYYVKAKNDWNDSNYTTFASVYRNKEKTPLFGTSFKAGTSPEVIKEWAKNKVFLTA